MTASPKRWTLASYNSCVDLSSAHERYFANGYPRENAKVIGIRVSFVMDPGTALGVVSLAFHLFSGCIKGCKLLVEASNMPEEYEYLRHRLKLEELNLLDWWQSSRVVEGTAYDDALAQTKKQLIVDSLDHIKSLTLDIKKIRDRYGLALAGVDDSDQTDEVPPRQSSSLVQILQIEGKRKALHEKALGHANASWKAYPKRLRWVAFDAASFERLVLRFAELNDFMLHLLESDEKRRHYRLQDAAHKELLRLHNRLDSIESLIRALQLKPVQQSHGEARDSESYKLAKLEQLARFKAFKITASREDNSCQGNASEDAEQQAPTLSRLETSQLTLHSATNKLTERSQRNMGMYGSDAVWVEWKIYDLDTTAMALSDIECRISCLAVLFKSPAKPDNLRLPSCMGYVHDSVYSRFGLVFDSLTAENLSAPQSFYSRLQTCMKPSLSLRIGMAQRLALSLGYLHAANWLHKGFRSDNVLFQKPSNSNWHSFWLSGFEYSRPADPDEVTELPSNNREHELYRHPDVQFDVPRDGRYGYKKQHDIYSLGVVLVEIGVWQPINQFLGISLNQRITRPMVRAVRNRLLEETSLALIEAEAGQLFGEAVKLCLDGEVVVAPDDCENGPPEIEAWVALEDGKDLDKAIEILNNIVV